jgi:hypothetical protein
LLGAAWAGWEAGWRGAGEVVLEGIAKVRVRGGEVVWRWLSVVVVRVLRLLVWEALERVDGGREVRFGGRVCDVEVLRGRPGAELVLAQECVEVGAVVGERVVVEADHWDWARRSAAQRCLLTNAATTVVAVVERVFSL